MSIPPAIKFFPNQPQQKIKMPIQNVREVSSHTEVPKEDSWDHATMHWLKDNGIGLFVLLGFAGIGVLTVFRKKIKEWLR